jgi:uncharacterized membrane protein
MAFFRNLRNRFCALAHRTDKEFFMRKSFENLDAHHRLFIAAVVALGAFLLTSGHLKPSIRGILAWNAFAWCFILFSWLRIFFADARTSVQTAKLEDAGRMVIFVFVIMAALISLFAVAVLIGEAKGLSKAIVTGHLFLAGGTVVSSWVLVHTVFTMRYAHVFYRQSDDDQTSTEGAGVEFPNEKEPDFLDFAYFSFVIGMTCQVSDVQISARGIRRLALVHGILSFLFNTVILALTINLASGLVS